MPVSFGVHFQSNSTRVDSSGAVASLVTASSSRVPIGIAHDVPLADALRPRFQRAEAASPDAVNAKAGQDAFGANYHIPTNTPYARYCLAAVLQFQFHRALSKTAGCTTPLHRCSIYGSAEAGKCLRATLDMGASRPWPDALETLAGQRQLDASAMVEYYAPLKAWLDEQNRNAKVGW